MAVREYKEVGGLTLGELLDGIVEQSLPAEVARVRVTCVCDDSRRVEPGSIFVAICGTQADGRSFVDDAVKRGAAVVIGEGLAPVREALTIDVPDARQTLGMLAVRWRGLDEAMSRGLRLIGVTGTNGKTTVAHMTQAILRAAGVRCGLLGTVRNDLCGRLEPARLTTPGPLELAERLAECVAAGAQAVVMEVSSHALDQRRTAGLRFAAAGFTNLTCDHLDYHETMDAYCASKARLFEQLDASGTAVVNADDSYHEAILAGRGATVVKYAIDRDADLTATILRESLDSTRYRLHLGDQDLELNSALIGRHNVYNAMAAAGLARAAGAPAEAIGQGLQETRGVPGRLERIGGLPGVEVFVDYAHTPDALRNVAGVLKQMARGRLVIVFGCGGERDRPKRPLMAQAAAEFGDALIVTSDNPRGEDPRRIIDDALRGLDTGARRRAIANVERGDAIHTALAAAKQGDVVLIAGKGHETCQIVGGQRIPFDDREAARAAIAALTRSSNGEA